MERARARSSVVVYGRGEVKRGRASVESIRRWVEGLSTLQCRNFPEKEDFARGRSTRRPQPANNGNGMDEKDDERKYRSASVKPLVNFSSYRLFRSPEIHREDDDLKFLASL